MLWLLCAFAAQAFAVTARATLAVSSCHEAAACSASDLCLRGVTGQGWADLGGQYMLPEQRAASFMYGARPGGLLLGHSCGL